MIAVVCVDDRGGLLFHGRRQSQDRALREDLLARCPGKLRMNGYSARLFAGQEERIAVDEDFLDRAGAGEWCFVEDRPLAPVAGALEGLVIYRWNRTYPGELYFDVELTDFTLVSAEDFPGSSHERLTREIYRRSGAV
jgi:hypothetical protein